MLPPRLFYHSVATGPEYFIPALLAENKKGERPDGTKIF
jgi:hypothetical protein